MTCVECTICMDLVTEQTDILALKCGHAFHKRCIRQWMRTARTCPKCRNTAVPRDSTILHLEFTEHPELRSLQERENLLNERLQMKEATINSMNDAIRTFETQLIAERENYALLTEAKNKLESDKNIEIAKMKNEMQAELMIIKTSREETLTKMKDLQLEYAFLSHVENPKLKSDIAELAAKLDQSLIENDKLKSDNAELRAKLDQDSGDLEEMIEENIFLKAELNDIDMKPPGNGMMKVHTGNTEILCDRMDVETITKSSRNIPNNVSFIPDPEQKKNMGLKRKIDETSGEQSTKYIKRLPDMPIL